MEKNLANTIREIIKSHINNNDGIVLGQCLSAVGWVQNTIPNQKKGIIELSMTDVAGSGMAVGAAIVGARPIFVMRFQSLVWLNSSPIVMHAAKAKEIFGYGAPVFIRAIASESSLGQGPLHANNYHSIFSHIPNLKVCSPMTSKEYKRIWNYFIKNDHPLFVSEHRNSYLLNKDLKNIYFSRSVITIFAISSSRFESVKAVKSLKKIGIECDLINVLWLNPFSLNSKELKSIKKTKLGLVIDASYEHCGITESISYKIMEICDCKVYAMGLKNISPGVSKKTENGTPSVNEIILKVKNLVSRK